MANAKAQHELVGVLVNLYPRLTVRLAEVTGAACPPYERVSAGPNTHQVRKEGKPVGDPHSCLEPCPSLERRARSANAPSLTSATTQA